MTTTATGDRATMTAMADSPYAAERAGDIEPRDVTARPLEPSTN